ncbi:Adenylate cyclase [Heracleum sosnowskyi]|uniref:Adenylate cyclase n=1 Tax=Heracleum sosnowskyi TaxID=360622 RepID=A0AAD8HP94_9APIA|nr:Adenylate cyclase [Heracleum sosnowskyi]KAK1370064.1 Adenylate cyclase [Heracleum sosnowskyi]
MTTATFSCIRQSTALCCFPRLKIIHTSQKFMGQIYIPVLNWFLLAFTLVLVCSISNIYEIRNAYVIAELGVMMMTTILVTLVMVLIWQINIVIVLIFVIIFLGMELIFFSTVLSSIGDGSWIILVFAIVMFLIMYIWNYGSKLKYETEVRKKMSMELMRQLGCNLGTVRAPGIGLLYNELVKGVPGIFGHFLTSLPAVDSMIIFVCVKYVPVPVVPQGERFLFRRVCSKSYHIFRCITRYGYKDVGKENHQTFEQLLIESLEKFILREAQERKQALHEVNREDPSVSDPEQILEKELSFIRIAKESGVVYLLGHGDIRARKESWFIKKLIISYFYAFLRKNCRSGIANLSVPHQQLI